MRQTVARLGATIDTATPAEVEEIIQRSLSERDIEEYEIKKGIIKLDATGAGTTVGSEMALSLKVSSQYDWEMERVAFGGGAQAASALIKILENSTNDTDLREVVGLGTAGFYSDSFSNNVRLTANSQVVIVVSGGPANGVVTFNLQIKLKRHRSQNGRGTR